MYLSSKLSLEEKGIKAYSVAQQKKGASCWKLDNVGI